MRPSIWGPARSTPWARLVWVCFAGAAISRPRAHGMRPYMGPCKKHAVRLSRLGLLRRGRHRKHANISADYLLGRVDEPRPLNDEKKEGTL